MTYPLSSEVSAGQPTYASQYNNLRQDALAFGQDYSDSLKIGEFLSGYAANLTLSLSGTTRLKIDYDVSRPPVIVIGQCMLSRTSTVLTPSADFSGLAAGPYYIVAHRTAASKTFTINVETAALNSDTDRTIGTAYWDGSAIQYWDSYFGTNLGMPDPDYESAWFAVTTGALYTKPHNLGVIPRLVVLLHSTSSSGASEQVTCFNMKLSAANQYYAGFGITTNNVLIETSTDAAGGTCYSTRRASGAGYYKVIAWL